jgi:hypothetical protein
MELIEKIKQQIEASKNAVELIQCHNPSNELLSILKITEHSILGTILKYTNGILIKNKFLRLLGAEDSEWTDSIRKWNNLPGSPIIENIPTDCIIFGYDILGGFFAINGGYFGNDLGNIFYFAPDMLDWENLSIGHSQFITWCISGDVDKFYEAFIWDNAEEMINKTKSGQGISIYPFLCSNEGKQIDSCSKKIVPLKELWDLNLEMKRKLGI